MTREECWDFLASLTDQGFTIAHIDFARFHLQSVFNHLGLDFPLPMIQPTQTGAIQFAWDVSSQYADIEVLPDGKIEWFIRNREANIYYGSDSPEANTLPFLDQMQRTWPRPVS